MILLLYLLLYCSALVEVSLSSIVSVSENDCPCIKSIDSPLRQQKQGGCDYNRTVPGILASNKRCYPLTYGTGECKAHEKYLTNSKCNNGQNSTACVDKWCYVDIERCKNTDHILFKSSSFPNLDNLFYSYSGCGTTTEHWPSINKDVAGYTLTVAFPIIFYPLHYKRKENEPILKGIHPEYYDDAIPWEGVFVNYFNALKNVSNNGLDFRFTSVSHGAEISMAYSTTDTAIFDVKAGIADIAGGEYLIKPDRLKMAAFTTPLFRSSYHIWIKQPDLKDDLYSNMVRVFEPFDPELWLVVIGLVLLVGLLSIWFSTENDAHPLWQNTFRGSLIQKKPSTSVLKRTMTTVLDSFAVQAQSLFGGGVDHNLEAAVSQRILGFGYSFMILIVGATYTANLAAFLSQSRVTEYASTMDDFISKNATICARTLIETELTSKYPKANFLFLPIPHSLIPAFERGECEAIVNDLMQVRDNYGGQQEGYCKNDLVFTLDPVLVLPSGIPIKPKYAPYFSYLIGQMNKAGGRYESFKEYPTPMCSLELREVQNTQELNRITPLNFFFPIIFLLFCAGVAIFVHLRENHLRKEDEKMNIAVQESAYNERRPQKSCREKEYLSDEDKKKEEIIIALRKCQRDVAEAITAMQKLQ